MANGVYHVGLGRILNLTASDLGCPDIPGLWEALRADTRHPTERQLRCIQCMRDQELQWMFLNERDGVRFASHYTRGIKDHPDDNEGDQHKAMKERIAHVAERAGFSVEVEDRSDTGKRRTDVLVKGAGGLLIGHEVQLSYATVASVRKRAAIARADGITPLWSTTNANAIWMNRVPSARTADAPWRDIARGARLAVLGGFRRLEMLACNTLPGACPHGRGYRCVEPVPVWRLPEKGATGSSAFGHTYTQGSGIQLDDLVLQSATGETVSIVVPNGREKLHTWVTAAELSRYLDAGGILLEESEKPRSREQVTHVQPIRPVDPECRYGQDSGFRSPLRRGSAAGTRRPPTPHASRTHPAPRSPARAQGVDAVKRATWKPSARPSALHRSPHGHSRE